MNNSELGADPAFVASDGAGSRLHPSGFNRGESIDPKELLKTIRDTVKEWAKIYRAASGIFVDPVYLASLANDIAFELGILEAAIAQPLSPMSGHNK